MPDLIVGSLREAACALRAPRRVAARVVAFQRAENNLRIHDAVLLDNVVLTMQRIRAPAVSLAIDFSKCEKESGYGMRDQRAWGRANADECGRISAAGRTPRCDPEAQGFRGEVGYAVLGGLAVDGARASSALSMDPGAPPSDNGMAGHVWWLAEQLRSQQINDLARRDAPDM